MEEEKYASIEGSNGFYEERKTTRYALNDIRVSYTKPSLLEQEQQRRLRAAEEEVRLMREKPRRRTKAQKLRERIKKNSTTKVPENQKPVPHYIARILTDKPLKTKDFDEMKRDGADSYHLQQSHKFVSSQGNKIGIPRAIYTDLLTAVVAEEETRMERHASRQRERLRSKDTLDTSTLIRNSRIKKSEPKVKRPHTAGSSRVSLNADSDYGTALSSSGLTQAKETGAPENAIEAANDTNAAIIEETTSNLLQSKLGRDRLDLLRTPGSKSGNSNSLKRERSSHLSTWGRPSEVSPQRLRREQLFKEREEGILKRIQDMEKRHRRESILKELQGRQYPWLFIVSHLSRIQLWRNKYLNEIKPMRDAEKKEKEANAQKHAVAMISGWWFYRRISLRIRLNPQAVSVLRVTVRRIWAILQRKKRHNGAKQVTLFLRDCVGSDKVKRMYTYRTKIIKIQRWFRSWYNLQEQRMQTLWKAMEIIGKRRVDAAQRDARIAERLAMKAMSEAAGFANILTHLNSAALRIDGYLSPKELEVKQRAEAEAIRSAIKEERKKKAGTGKAKNSKGGGKKTLQRLPSSNHLGAGGTRWMRRMYVNPATREHFVALRDILRKERMRHVLAVMESEKRHTTRNLGRALPKVNLEALKEFLVADPCDVDENFDFFEDEEEEDKGKDKKAKRQKSRGKYQAHPIFLLYSQGGLEFLRNAPLDFFIGVVPGFEGESKLVL